MKKQTVTILFILLFVSTMLVIEGCAHSRHHGRSRGKLSGATRQAADDSEETQEKRKAVKRQNDSLRSAHPYRIFYNRFHDYHDEVESTFSWICDSSSGVTSGFDLSLTNGLLMNEDFYGISGTSLALWRYDTNNRHRIDIHGSVYSAPVQETSALSKAIKGGVFLLSAKMDLNLYTTPSHTFMGQYFIFGIGYNYMLWSYVNPVVVDSDSPGGGYNINNDALEGIELYTGAGLHLVQTRFLNLGVELTPGVIFWLGPTAEGFENDVFRPFWYTRLDFKLGVPVLRR